MHSVTFLVDLVHIVIVTDFEFPLICRSRLERLSCLVNGMSRIRNKAFSCWIGLLPFLKCDKNEHQVYRWPRWSQGIFCCGPVRGRLIIGLVYDILLSCDISCGFGRSKLPQWLSDCQLCSRLVCDAVPPTRFRGMCRIFGFLSFSLTSSRFA